MGEVIAMNEEDDFQEVTEAIGVSACEEWLDDDEEQDRIGKFVFFISEFLSIANYDTSPDDELLIGLHFVSCNIQEWSLDNQKKVLTVLAKNLGLKAHFTETENNNG